MIIDLYPYQLDAIRKMKNGCILCGGVGSGKSRTSLAYYYLSQGGKLNSNAPMLSPKDLYIITTAKKRDTFEWEKELAVFGLSTQEDINPYKNKIVIDSWNNIKKYENVEHSFFIFDEQRVVGYGAWTKAFLKITRKGGNSWILLSATPGDTWSDYIPVFMANGFYRTKTEFQEDHIIYNRFTKYPQVDRYINTGKLLKYRNDILVDMDFKRTAEAHHEDIFVEFDLPSYRAIVKQRFNPWKNEPIENASEFCYCLRRVVNEDESRIVKVMEIMEHHTRAIIFYNFDYELDILKSIPYEKGTVIAEWNGHKHEEVPKREKWVYLVQYTAGAEGWNCTDTDTMIFYSQNYSYKTMMQASGRIDRLNTPYSDLWYYHLRSRSGIDIAIKRALTTKKRFNETAFTGK